MSISIHFNGRKRSDMKKTLHDHQLRVDEETGRKAKLNSDSAINPKLSSLNQNLFDDPNHFLKMRTKITKISRTRVKNGGKKLYKTANVLMVGTLQLSDDTLFELGWRRAKNGKKLPADEQSEVVRKNVATVYQDTVQSMIEQPEIYGQIFSATIHFDEGSPHVDLMSDPLDIDKPNQLARDFLNGPKGSKKGQALRTMQDNLTKYSRLDAQTRERFKVFRGDSASLKVDKARRIRSEEKKLDSEKNIFLNQKKQWTNKTNDVLILVKDKFEAVEARGADLNRRELNLNQREETLNKREVNLKAYETQLRQKRSDIDQKASEARQGLFEANRRILQAKKVEEANRAENERLTKLEEDLKEWFKKIKKLGNSVSRLFHRVERGEKPIEARDKLGAVSKVNLNQDEPSKGLKATDTVLQMAELSEDENLSLNLERILERNNELTL